MKPTKGQTMTMQQVYVYLTSRGVPKQKIHQIREALIYDAVTEGTDLKYDRIYTGIALMLRRAYGFGQERILKGLREFDKTVGSVLQDGEDSKDWTDLIRELEEETGIQIHTGSDNRLICEAKRPEKAR